VVVRGREQRLLVRYAVTLEVECVVCSEWSHVRGASGCTPSRGGAVVVHDRMIEPLCGV
jgi:hypothetical protein